MMRMAAGGFPIDLILFGLIAAFLALRLRGILGRRTGFEQPPPARPMPASLADPRRRPAIEGRAEPASAPRAAPDPASLAGQDIARLRAADPGFDPMRFLAAAEQAFRLVVEAYAAGNRDALRPLLTEDTYRVFNDAIAAREASQEIQRTELRRIDAVTITGAGLRAEPNRAARIGEVTVRFVSDQINTTLDKNGRYLSGVDAVTEMVDLWTFERDLDSKEPTWRLGAARSG